MALSGGCHAHELQQAKGEKAVHSCHYPGDMAVRMREVLARPWVGVYAPCFLSVLVSSKVISTMYKRKLKYYIKHYILI